MVRRYRKDWFGAPGGPPIRRSKYWLADNKILCTTPRAASSSMNEAMNHNYSFEDAKYIKAPAVLDEKNKGTKIIMWHRDPLDRYGSAYFLLGRKNPDEFAERVLTQSNPHWDTQVDLHSYNGIFLPNQIYRFEDLNNTWPLEYTIRLGKRRINSNRPNWEQIKGKMSSNYIIEIMNKYEEDILFHENIQ